MKVQKVRYCAGVIGFCGILFVVLLTASCKKDSAVEPANISGSPKSITVDSSLNTQPQNNPSGVITPPTNTTTPTTSKTTNPTTPATSKTTAPTQTTTVPVNNILTSSSFGSVKLTNHIALYGAHDITIKGDSINGVNVACISLNSCYNIHITKCKLMNSSLQGVFMYDCTNISIDSCFISNVSAGVYAHACGQIKVNSNEFLNMRGPVPAGNFVQFNNVSGGGNQINYNKCEDIMGSGINPNPGGGDGISLFQSNGTAASPIQVYGNWIRGGGTNTGASGMAGIVAGDVGGSYQDIENNILVNTGYVGIQQQGGSNLTIANNSIYSANLPWSGGGLISANYSGTASNNNTIANNKINWIAGYLGGARRDTAWKPGAGSNINARPINWNNNIPAAPINASILPATIITWK